MNPGDSSGEATPVPIPNTEVKLSSAEDTERAAFRENRSSPGFLRSRGQGASPGYALSVGPAVSRSDLSLQRDAGRLNSPSGGFPSLCPFLTTEGGTWRGARPLREHRCSAVSPPVPLVPERQRRLCLSDGHLECTTYLAAVEGRARVAETGAASGVTRRSRPLARMSPIVLDQDRIEWQMPAIRVDRASGQLALVAILGVALAVVVLGRPTGEPGGRLGGTVASNQPTAGEPGPSDGVAPSSPPAPARPTAAAGTPSASPSTTASEGAATPSSSASAPPAPVASATPDAVEPSLSGATYTVKPGDNLLAIASRFGTTTKMLIELNDLADPRQLKIGQVLILP